MAQEVMPGVLMMLGLFGGVLIAFGIFFYRIAKRTRALDSERRNERFMKLNRR